MAWSFRFATLNKSKMTQIMTSPRLPHLDIAAWLDLLELRQYQGKSSRPNYSHMKLNGTIFQLQTVLPNSLASKSWFTSAKRISNSWGFGTRLIVHEWCRIWLHCVTNTTVVRISSLTSSIWWPIAGFCFHLWTILRRHYLRRFEDASLYLCSSNRRSVRFISQPSCANFR